MVARLSHNVFRLHADTEVCIGAGMCATTAPDVFDQDDGTGLVDLRTQAPAEAHLAAVRRAVACCPSGALMLSAEPAPETPPRLTGSTSMARRPGC
ncbi:(4Fe-4S)-binding protein [Mycobacterium sp. CPCC 205372]|uniref:Ferredoxin n=1 Tax=Mycobacterium hippophais TaxID=3016340 RepID=A0ABT4PTS0_9MYCO|nr:(4Fe-4S)-binding protein [Mycobacterium hippophais]MCZ8379982.1 (4Fe-4S)-binding protein [Mycobacterium hippophais]